MYAYVTYNPLSYTDPSGMGFWSDLFGRGEIAARFADYFLTLFLGAVLDTGDAVWSEELPLGVSWGTRIATGDIFGSGNTGPFINNILQTAGGTGWDLTYYGQAIAYLQRDPTMARMIHRLQRSRRVYTVSFIRNGEDVYQPENGRVLWDPTSSLLTTAGGCQSAALGLGHEFAHAYEDDKYPYWFARESGVSSAAYGNQVERWAIVGPEASAARILGEPTRSNHGGSSRHEADATSRTCRIR